MHVQSKRDAQNKPSPTLTVKICSRDPHRFHKRVFDDRDIAIGTYNIFDVQQMLQRNKINYFKYSKQIMWLIFIFYGSTILFNIAFDWTLEFTHQCLDHAINSNLW
jgi:hypothetical protein